MFERIDRWIDKMESSDFRFGTCSELKFIVSEIIAMTESDIPFCVAITGTVSREQKEWSLDLLRNAADDMGVSHITFIVVDDVASINKNNHQGVLLLEQKKKSICKAVDREITFLNNTKQNILGMILV